MACEIRGLIRPTSLPLSRERRCGARRLQGLVGRHRSDPAGHFRRAQPTDAEPRTTSEGCGRRR